MIFDKYEQVGYYSFNGPDKEADTRRICTIFGEKSPECRRVKGDPTGFGQTFSVKMQKHSQQNMIEGRFQEYSDTYAKFGVKVKNRVRITNKIDLSDVENAAPVHIFMAGDDRVCSVKALDLL